MGIDKLTPLGETGNLASDVVYDAFVSNGWSAERVKASLLDKAFNKGDNKINEILTGTGKGTPLDTGEEAFIKGLFTPQDSVASPLDPGNFLDAEDDTKAYFNLSYTVISGAPTILAANYVTGAYVDVFDLDAMTLDSENDLTAALPSGGGETWATVDICNDGTHAFVLFEDTTNNTFQVQSFLLTDWSTNTAWPSTGLALSGSGSPSVKPKIKYVADDKLAVIQTWITITADTDAAVAILDATDGTLDGEGAGDVTYTSNTDAAGLSSDGTYVFFVVRDLSADNVQICSMPIASPGGTGCGGTYWPVNYTDITDASNYRGAMACSGSIVVVGFSKDTDLIRFIAAEIQIGASVVLKTSGTGEPNAIYNIIWDGLGFWATGGSAKDPTDTYANPAILKLTGALKGWTDGGSSDPAQFESSVDNVDAWSALITPADALGTPDDVPCVHDGNGLWYVPVPDAGDSDYSGKIARFAKTLLR